MPDTQYIVCNMFHAAANESVVQVSYFGPGTQEEGQACKERLEGEPLPDGVESRTVYVEPLEPFAAA